MLNRLSAHILLFSFTVGLQIARSEDSPEPKPLLMSDIVAAASPQDWRPLDPDNTLYLDLPAGRVIIELAPVFAPNHVANVTALAREGYFDGLAFMRSQENYVVQWGDAGGKKPLQKAQRTLAAEFERPLRGVTLARITDP